MWLLLLEIPDLLMTLAGTVVAGLLGGLGWLVKSQFPSRQESLARSDVREDKQRAGLEQQITILTQFINNLAARVTQADADLDAMRAEARKLREENNRLDAELRAAQRENRRQAEDIQVLREDVLRLTRKLEERTA